MKQLAFPLCNGFDFVKAYRARYTQMGDFV
jgi:hypothetical protein